jgi:hypothetical protein
VKDLIVTVVAAIVLAVLFMYAILSLAFSGWGDPSPSGSYFMNQPQAPATVFVDSRVARRGAERPRRTAHIRSVRRGVANMRVVAPAAQLPRG